MALSFSHSVGYRGLFRVGACTYTPMPGAAPSTYALSGSMATLLCTGGNISLTQEPIMGSGVWGAGYMNAGSSSYAYNYLSLEGSGNFELTTDFGAWYRFGDIIQDRSKPLFINLLPDGWNGYHGGAWVSQLGFECSEGAAVTGNMSFKGDPGGKVGNNPAIVASGEPRGNASWSSWGAGYGGNIAGDTLVPYWRTGMGFGTGYSNSSMSSVAVGPFPAYNNGVNQNMQGVQVNAANKLFSDVTSWSVNYNSDVQMLKCVRYETTSPLSADYILCGEASCDGSYTIFRVSGEFAPGAYHKKRRNMTFLINANHADSVSDHPSSGQGYETATDSVLWVVVPYCLISSGSTSMTTGAQYVTSEFSFTGIGDGISPIMNIGPHASSGN